MARANKRATTIVTLVEDKKMKKATIIAFISLSILSGCGLLPDVMVLSSVKPPPYEIRKNYFIMPDPEFMKNEHVEHPSLIFLELKEQVVKVLASRGFVEIAPENAEDLGRRCADRVNYECRNGCSRREIELAHSDCPIIISLSYGVDVSKTHGGYIISGQTQNFGMFDSFSGEITPYVKTEVSSKLILRAMDTAEQLITGGQFVIDKDGVYHIKGGDTGWGWVTSAIMTNSSGDIQRDFPFLLAAIKPYIATSTGNVIEVRLMSDDKRVVEIKNLLDHK